MLLDQWGRPIRRSALKGERAAATRAGARTVLHTRAAYGLTPSRMAAILRRAETPGYGATREYAEMVEAMEEKDPHLLGVLQTRKRQVARIPIKVVPADDSAEAEADAEPVREFFARDSLVDEMIDLLDAVPKGYSVAEIDWETSERQWMPRRLQWRLPQWFDFDPVGGQRLLRLDDAGRYVEMEPYKFVTHISSAKSGLPIRGGLGRCLAWAWMFKRFSMQDWARFGEAYGQPIRIGYYHPLAEDEDIDVLERAVRRIAADASCVLPEGMRIEFEGVDQASARSDIYKDFIAGIDSQVAIAVLGQTLTTQAGDTGSYALGQVHNLVREDIEWSDARQLAQTLTRDVAIPIVALNRGHRKRYPRVVIEREKSTDLELFAKTVERLAPLGLRVRTEDVYARLNIDPPADGDEVLEPRAPAPAAPAGGNVEALARALSVALAAANGGETPPDPNPPARLPTAEAVADAVGPLIDRWAARLREGAGEAASLARYRDWLDRRAFQDIDVGPAAEDLGQALLAAYLAGRYDVGGERTATAADEGGVRRQFGEQIRFFRRKLNLTTESWTDIWRAQHDIAFVVAGAAKRDLLMDLRGAVDAAIADGETLEKFRQRFDAIVEKLGWSYKGGRNWRTKVIYSTNLRTSYAAGRYEQMKAVAERRPWWRYRHSHASNEPREKHLAWDGLTLRHDDPWWAIHYPPNGWGCKCYVESLTDADLRALGKDGPDTAPPLRTERVTVGARGPNPRTVTVPVGIDPGWDYAPGRSVAQRRHQANFARELDARIGEGRYRMLLNDIGRSEAAAAAPQLTPAELAVVRWYSLSGSSYINEQLRGTLPMRGGRGELPTPLETAAALTLRDALAKLPERRGVTYRGIPRITFDAINDQLRSGEILSVRDFISSSKSEEQARRFGSAAQFTIIGRTGRDIQLLAANPNEREVLFNPYARFRVVSREEGRPNRWGEPGRVMIELEEVADD